MMKLILALLFSMPATATLNDVDFAYIRAKNILKNPGFENGKQSWTASGGAFSIASSGSDLLTGKVSVTWNATASTQTLTSAAITIPNGLKGVNGLAACKIMVASGTAVHTLEAYDGSSVLGAVTVTSSTTPTYTYSNFIFPSSGTIRLRLQSQADEPSITVDDCFLGSASETNISQISQAQFIGSAYFAPTASCTGWTRTNTAIGAYATDAECPAPTVEHNPGPGIIQTTDADLPQITVTNLPPGRYHVVASTISRRAGGNTHTLAVYDGTSYSGHVSGFGSSGESNNYVMNANFVYTTTQSSITFAIHGSSDASSTTIHNDAGNTRTTFSIYRYQLSTEQVYTPATSAVSWSGYHDNTCSWARTNTAYGDPTADATCVLTEGYNRNFGTVTTAGAALPGVIFTAPRVGRYFACANIKAVVATNNTAGDYALLSGSATIAEGQIIGTTNAAANSAVPLCGIFSSTTYGESITLKVQSKAASGATTIAGVSTTSRSAIEWSIIGIDQQMPAPILVNSVVSPSSGVLKVMSALIQNANGTSSITRQDGSWISSVTDNTTGDVTVNIRAGTCSTIPSCVCSASIGAEAIYCILDTTTATSTTAARFKTYSSAPALANKDFNVICTCQP